MATATVYIWKGNHKFYKMLGAGHAGLKIKTHDEVKYYITWYPRGKAVLLKTEANMKLGFAQRTRVLAGQLIAILLQDKGGRATLSAQIHFRVPGAGHIRGVEGGREEECCRQNRKASFECHVAHNTIHNRQRQAAREKWQLAVSS